MSVAFPPDAARRGEGLAEGEGVGLDAGIEEPDLEGTVGDVATLADELVEPLAGYGAVAVRIDVAAVVGARGRAVDGDLEAHRLAVGARAQHQMQVAGVEAIGDAAVLGVQ